MNLYNIVDPSKLDTVTPTNVHNTYRFPKRKWEMNNKLQCMVNTDAKQRTSSFFRVVGEEEEAYIVLYKVWF